MTVKEMIKNEIDNIPEESLTELHQVIMEFKDKKKAEIKENGNLLLNLRQIKIHGPKDFSEKVDDYLRGEVSEG